MSAKNDLRELKEAIECARFALSTIGKALLDDESMKIWNLISEIQNVEEASGIVEFGTAAGGFASQKGRLGAVLEQIARIAGVALDASGENCETKNHAPNVLN
ncbi:hypothetical protein OKW30_001178 [Paraburkholderia sp. Clong3]|uniref:hypothetical protein n=1 Tax=Paraburkholderia sp. Clong3 TaxID=2991061 RepID=UPI003D1F91DA